ncbi:MAG: radical SAM protein [Acidobacteria bacterium]|jgi:uncharacterized protein|nr:radical SAM protein [Acidobacteriota bacterium]
MAGSVFVIPVLDRWLVYAPLHHASALVNRAAVCRLSEDRVQPEQEDLASLSSLIRSEPPGVPQPREGLVSPQFLGLIPTRACNLRCVYCGFGAADGGCEVMDMALAVAAVDWMAADAQRRGRATLDVHFFGGEPFFARDVVEVVVHRTRAVAAEKGLVPRLEAATNGVYDEDCARFIGDYFEAVVLSFDGFPQVHDRRRSAVNGRGSFEAVARTARILSQSPAELCFRVCVADDNVDHLAETVSWFCRQFQPAAIDFETLQPTSGAEEAGLRPPDPYRFAAQFHSAGRIASDQGVRPSYAAALRETPRTSFCPVGNDTLILSPEGRVSACYLPKQEWQARGLDLEMGRFTVQGAMELDRRAIERVRSLAAAKPRCAKCFCRWSCAGGCHVNQSFPGCPQAYNDFCIQTRLITACSLLAELGADSLADRLLDDRSAMEALALRTSDALEDCEEADG